MEATTIGMNRTGTAVSPLDAKAMTDAADQLTPAVPIDTSAADADRLAYISELETVGSIPPPASTKGVLKAGMAKMKGGAPSVLLDKIGERIAYEPGGVRLYEALITKYEALQGLGHEVLVPADQLPPMDGAPAAPGSVAGEAPVQTLMRLRSEELEHFSTLRGAMVRMGGDPTAQTPCADVQSTASMGIGSPRCCPGTGVRLRSEQDMPIGPWNAAFGPAPSVDRPCLHAPNKRPTAPPRENED